MTTATVTPAALAPLFEPITLGNVEIRNRVVMTGHGTGMAKDYLPTDQHVAYYRERAMGGTGLIGMAFPQIHPTSQDVPGEPRSWLPEIVPGLHKITSAVHEYGARIVMQLGHGGRQGHSTFTERALWSPSNTPCPFNLEMPKEMEIEDIDEIIAAHAVGARHAKQGGMDGVEIHSGYGGYLLASFLSPFSNHRTDEYGGSLENRMRIVLRVIDAVRAEVGPDYLVGMNLQGHDFSPGGLEVSDAQQIAQVIAATGNIDYICVKAATYNEAHQNVPDMQHPKRIWESLAAAIKSVVDIPVIAVGRINDRHDAPANRRSRDRQQDARGPPRRNPALHRLQPGLHRSAVQRHPLLVRAQSGGRLRTGAGNRHTGPGDVPPTRCRHRRRTGRAEGRRDRSSAGSRCDPHRASQPDGRSIADRRQNQGPQRNRRCHRSSRRHDRQVRRRSAAWLGAHRRRDPGAGSRPHHRGHRFGPGTRHRRQPSARHSLHAGT